MAKDDKPATRSTVDNAKAKAKEVAIEDFNKARTVALAAANSGSYLYPIKGILYYLSHRSLWKPMMHKIIPTLTLSVSVVVLMFMFTYVPQVAIMFFTSGPLAPFTTILLILSESSTIITMLSQSFIIQEALIDTFDATLVAQNETGIVAEGRQITSGGDPVSMLGKLAKSPFEKFTPKALIRYFMYLPLNFIPLVGTAIFVFIQGRTRGKSAHTRYFELKKWSPSERESFLQEHVGPYTAFGTVATLLELVPVASILLLFTNTVGAALWAADLEKSNTNMSKTTAPKLHEAVKKVE